ncbi:ligand-gated ion channel [Pseudodonghicola flavimaris]|uniref:Uncharacterized protein n=1 Tax=Pseudodonghicola flavimaris TaxID=3050036 RepID=A0ABT7F5K0_9RHOB|nr:hypothetical protein [Pseudodonghicola flavimaris]MDK3019893.1 hypothetical protein [Pseudodonghicola flavimaris]
MTSFRRCPEGRIATPLSRWPGLLPFLALSVWMLLAILPGRLAAETLPREVRVGVYVTSVFDVEPSDGGFGIAGYAWFIDPEGTFDPEHGMQLLARSAQTRIFVDTELEDGARYAVMEFQAVYDHAFDVRNYPFDRQSLPMVIEAASTVSDIVFVPDTRDSRVASNVRAPGWSVAGFDLASSMATYDTGFGHRAGHPSFSRLTATVSLARNMSPLLFEKFSGFFVAFAITALVIFVPLEELGIRVGMSTGSVFAAVFNRYRLEDAVGFDAVFGLIDQVSFLIFSLIIATLFLSLFSHRLSKRRGPAVATRTDHRLGLTILIVHAALLALAFGVVLF